MYAKHWRSIVVGSALLLAGGCASSEEWQIWRSNTSHFQSKEHFDFSMKNRSGAPNQSWFGKAVTVDQGQILER